MQANGNDVQEDIVNAMALTGQFLMGQAVMVKSSEVSCVNSLLIMMQSCKVHTPAVSSALFLRVSRVYYLPLTNSKKGKKMHKFHQTPHKITSKATLFSSLQV